MGNTGTTRGGLCLLGLVLMAAAPAFADRLEALVGAEAASRLREGEVLTEAQLRKPAFSLLPGHGAVREAAGALLRDLGAGVMAEAAACYLKPSAPPPAPAPAPGPWTEAQRAALYNGALAISTLAGTEYYSPSRKRMRVFYETSAVIDAPDTRRPLPDPVCAAPPPRLALYARQKDLTFGDNIYRYEYFALEDAFYFTQENLTVMSAGPIPALGKGKLRSLFAVIDAGDCLLFYAVSLAKAAALPGLGERVSASFTNRAAAVLKWYTGHAERAFYSDQP